VAGTNYEAPLYAVFSNFLSLSATKFYPMISTVPKQSLQSFSISQINCHTTNIKVLSKCTHVYTSKVSFLKAGKKTKHNEVPLFNAQASFPLNVFIPQFLLLNATPNYF